MLQWPLGHCLASLWLRVPKCMHMIYEIWCKTLQELLASPSASCTRGRPSCTRGSLPRVQHSGKSLRLIRSRWRRLPRVSKIVHSGKASPSAGLTLGEDLTPLADGRRRLLFFFDFFPRVQHSGKIFKFFLNTLCRVPQLRHSAKKFVFF